MHWRSEVFFERNGGGGMRMKGKDEGEIKSHTFTLII